MKKIYQKPSTSRATYNEMILDVNPGSSNGGDYNGEDVDARERNDFDDEVFNPEEIKDSDSWQQGLW